MKIFLIVAGIVLIVLSVSVVLSRKPKTVSAHLPDDVDSVVENYQFKHTSDEEYIEVSGRRIVRRGGRFLGVRSNLLKKNYLADIKGVYRTGQKVLRFGAKEAEWEMKTEAPLFLKEGFWVDISNIIIDNSGVKTVKIDFKKGFIETSGTNRKIYNLN